MAYQVVVTVEVPDVEAESEDDAINFVTEAIEDSFNRLVSFTDQRAVDYTKGE
jgi:hypothetical protein